MPRYTRNSAILAKIESAYAQDAAPSGAANAVLVSNLSVNPFNAENVPRDLIRSYYGASEHLPGVAYVELSFDVEIQSSGSMTAPTIPAWGALVRACGFAETGTASVRVEYNPVSAAFEAATLYYYDDGVLKKALGGRGSATLKLGVGERPVFSFRFIGLDGGDSAQTNPALTLTAWQKPLVVTDPNTGDILLGCTYNAATPALTAGTAYPSRGIEIDLGGALNHVPLLGGESCDITDREITGRLMLDLSAAQEVANMTAVKAVTLQSLGLQHGTAAGYKMLFYAPAVQLINPRKEAFQGRRLIGYDLRFQPVSGNDELKIVAA